MQKKLRAVATEVRQELIRLAPIFYNDPQKDLGGLCGYGSVMLFERFRKMGLSAKIASGSCHWFIICEGFLVDITASQFGQSKVCVKKYDRIVEMVNSGEYALNFWKTVKTSDSYKAMGLAGNIEAVIKARKKY